MHATELIVDTSSQPRSEALASRAFRQLVQADTFDLSLVLGLITLLLYGDEHWYARVPTTVAGLCALAIPELRRSRTMWVTLAGVLLASDAVNWYRNDNHKFLMGYYCVAAFAALCAQQREAAFATSARMLIGLCFACATLWKLGSTDFVDGRFLRQAMLVDERFHGLTIGVAGVTTDDLKYNDEALSLITQWGAIVPSVELRGVDKVGTIADIMTWWTVFIEGMIAVSFLAPTRTAISRLRDPSLLLFVASTYVFASVLGFASILLALGIAQTSRTAFHRLAYFASFALLQVYTIPWRELFGI